MAMKLLHPLQVCNQFNRKMEGDDTARTRGVAVELLVQVQEYRQCYTSPRPVGVEFNYLFHIIANMKTYIFIKRASEVIFANIQRIDFVSPLWIHRPHCTCENGVPNDMLYKPGRESSNETYHEAS